MSTVKHFIGSGKPTKFEGITVTLRMEEARKHISENGEWLSFIVSPRKQMDEKGRTHNAFVIETVPEAAPAVPAEPEPSMAQEPIAETPKDKKRRLRRISAEEAASRRAMGL